MISLYQPLPALLSPPISKKLYMCKCVDTHAHKRMYIIYNDSMFPLKGISVGK